MSTHSDHKRPSLVPIGFLLHRFLPIVILLCIVHSGHALIYPQASLFGIDTIKDVRDIHATCFFLPPLQCFRKYDRRHSQIHRRNDANSPRMMTTMMSTTSNNVLEDHSSLMSRHDGVGTRIQQNKKNDVSKKNRKKALATKSKKGTRIPSEKSKQMIRTAPVGTLSESMIMDLIQSMNELSTNIVNHSLTRNTDHRRSGRIVSSSSSSSSSSWTRRDAMLVERILDRLVEEKHAGNLHAIDLVDTKTYNLAINAWSNTEVRRSAPSAEHILKRLISDSTTTVSIQTQDTTSKNTTTTTTNDTTSSFNPNEQQKRIKPDIDSYISTIMAWYKAEERALRSVNDSKSANVSKRRANRILQMMKDDIDIDNMSDSERNEIRDNFNVPIDTLSKLTGAESTTAAAAAAARQSERLLNFLEDWSLSSNGKIGPDIKSYNSVLMAYAKSSKAGDENAAIRAEAILKRMEKRRPQYHPHGVAKPDEESSTDDPIIIAVTPNVASYTSVISAFANCRGGGKSFGARKAQQIFQTMERQYEKTNDSDIRPDTVAYNAVLNALGKSRTDKVRNANRAESIAKRMQQLFESGVNLDAKPSDRTLSLVVSCWTNCMSPMGLRRAEEYLWEMQRRYESGESDIRPNVIGFTTIIDGYAKLGGKDAAKRARSILGWMEQQRYRSGNHTDMKPTARTYCAVLNAIGNNNGSGAVDRDASQKAESILRRMEQQHKTTGDKSLKPNTRVYNAIINIYANSPPKHKKESAMKAERVLNKMKKMYNAGDRTVRPDVISYTSTISAWSGNGEEGAIRAEAILDSMKFDDVKPNSRTFNAAIEAWTKSGKLDYAARKAESLLERMEELYQAGNDESVKPSAFTYTLILDAWAKSGEKGSAKRAEVLLQLMEVMYKDGHNDIKPNTVSYTTVINAIGKSGENGSSDRAQALLERMERLYEAGDVDVKPNVFTYTAVIDCFARSGERDAAHRASELLKRMEHRCETGVSDVKPNTRTYNAVINAWAKSKQMKAPQKTESLLKKMEDLYDATGNEDVKPTAITYVSVINSWVSSPEPNKARNARKLLRRMEELYKTGNNDDVKPNVFAYTAVINACALCFGNNDDEKKEALQIAYETFKELEESSKIYGRPNHVTYATFLKACCNLMPSEEMRSQVVEAIFRKCCRDGQVDGTVLDRLRDAASEELFSKLMGGIRSVDINGIGMRDLPREWSCNVKFSRNRTGKN